MKRRARDDDGAAAVEFALLFIPFVSLLMGLVEFGFFFWTAETTNSAARETARRVVVGDCWADPHGFAVNHGPRITGTTVSPSPTTTSVGDKIVVTVTADSRLLAFIPGIPPTVERAYEARMEVDESSMGCS